MKNRTFINSQGFEVNAPDAPAAAAFATRDYRGNAKDARDKMPLCGLAVPVMLQQTGDTRRYIALDTWQAKTTAAAAASVYVGKQNKNMLRYQCVIETRGASVELHANMIAANGSAPLWYATESGYASPNFANAKWHDKLESVFRFVESATVTVYVTDETGRDTFPPVTVSGNRDVLGRYVKKDENGKTPLLRMIDAVTIDRKGYSNYPKRKKH